MNLTAKVWKSALAVTGLCLISASARADMNYTFIHMDCDPASQTAKIKVFYDWNDTGKARAEHPEKGTYYLNDIARPWPVKDITAARTKATCEMASHNLALVAHKGEVPNIDKDNIEIFIDKKTVPGFFNVNEKNIEIKFSSDSDYTVKDCLSGPYPSYKTKCQSLHIVDGKAVSQ